MSSLLKSTNANQLSPQLEDLRLIPFVVAVRVLGIKKQLAADWKWKKKFPVTVVKINGSLFVKKSELIEYISSKFSQQKLSLSKKHVSISSVKQEIN